MSNSDDDLDLDDFDDFDHEVDDDAYDEVLDSSFEDDFDSVDSDSEADLDDFDPDEDWDDFDDEDDGNKMEVGAGLAKTKKSFMPDMSFNAMVITGAVILGVCVLGYQVVTKKPELTIAKFRSALNMSGATDGPVFGEEEVQSTELTAQSANGKESTTGFLHNPEALEKMEMVVEEAPPMPTTITEAEDALDMQELAENEKVDSLAITNNQTIVEEEVLTPLPEQTNGIQVPRAPDANGESLKDLFGTPIENNDQEPPAKVEVVDALEETKVADIEEPPPNTAITSTNKFEGEFDNISRVTENDTEQVQVEQEIEEAQVEIKEIETVETEAVVTPQEEMPKISSANLSAVQNNDDIASKLDTIVSRLDDMEIQIKQIQAVGDSRVADLSKDFANLKKNISNVRTSTSASKNVTSKKAVQKAKQKKPSVKKSTVNAKRGWELRAAQPGKAWVSRQGQQDMQSVMVGDRLSDIGRITAINFDGNKWSVKGTAGVIRQ